MSEHIIETEVWAGTPFVPVGGTGKLCEEIVRCRDCRYHVIYETWSPKGEKHHCNSFGQDTDADGFCAWGERK